MLKSYFKGTLLIILLLSLEFYKASFFFLKPKPELFLLTISIFFYLLNSSFFLNIVRTFSLEVFFSSAFAEDFSKLRNYDLLQVFSFYNFSSWILMVLEKRSLTFTFIKGIYNIFLMDGLLFGSFMSI